MPTDFTSLVYSEPLRWIRNEREVIGTSWEDIRTRPSGFTIIQDFLNAQNRLNQIWPDMDEPTWKALVSFQEEQENKTIELDVRSGQALVIDGTSNNNVFLPYKEETCWQLYKAKLEGKGFAQESIGEIERSTLRILRRLSIDTRETGPIKGMVIGNVQSGKTANMAALMAMAADWGWNMFIILTGTIENLRDQNQKRLWRDLNNDGGTLSWRCLTHLSARSPEGDRAQDLNFEGTSPHRYFTTCLKNATRLRGLIQWLQRDRNKMKQMKILVIDDEADQAGINTAIIDTGQRKQINKLICALVNGLNAKSQTISDKYLAMNYIGYTATPYANILNEASRESLYPKNFIATLSVSNQYFGPQQIFGSPDGRYGGLDIVRDVPVSDLDIIKNIHNGDLSVLPDSFKDAVCWFICCVSAMRFRKLRKPFSMLVHTSQKVMHHERVSDLLESWINSADKEALLARCRTVWASETRQFSIDEFKEQYQDYGQKDSLVDYPSFEDIEAGIREILSVDLQPIKLDQEGELTYHKGIHLCVDNYRNNGINDSNEHLRLVYPDKYNMPDTAPAFIVIGGATLSRGLTLEGLVCTYFLRSVRQADTLMQMGRWFGYRKGYELYPRIWLTANTVTQFEYLSTMDQELREEIHMMEVCGLTPDRYAARIRNTPRLNLIRITAQNRMQSAIDVEMDYSGSYSQTYLFDNDLALLEENLEAGRRFVEGLGTPRPQKACNPHSAHAAIWENIPFARIKDFLEEFHFCKNLLVFNDLKPLFSWVERITAEGNLRNWNVVFAGKRNADGLKTWNLSNCSVAKVTRTRKNTEHEDEAVINIGALRAPADLIADVDLDGRSQEVKDYFANLEERRMKEARMRGGLGETPQLLLYIVDKDSAPRAGSQSRKPLDAPCDILGLCVNIPGGTSATNHVAKVSIKLDNSPFDDSDLDEGDQ